MNFHGVFLLVVNNLLVFVGVVTIIRWWPCSSVQQRFAFKIRIAEINRSQKHIYLHKSKMYV